MDLKKSTKSVSKPQIWPKSQIFLHQCSLFTITQNLWNFHRDTACTTEVTEKCHFLAFSKTSRLFETVLKQAYSGKGLAAKGHKLTVNATTHKH